VQDSALDGSVKAELFVAMLREKLMVGVFLDLLATQAANSVKQFRMRIEIDAARS
jgi:hypothetical protein